MDVPIERLFSSLHWLLMLVALDQILSPIILRGAVAAFNALARQVNPAAAAAVSEETSTPTRKRLVEGKPVRKKQTKRAEAFPTPTGGQAVVISAVTIAGLFVVSLIAGLLFPPRPRTPLADFALLAAGLRIAVQSVVLTSILAAPLLRCVVVAVLDAVVRWVVIWLGIAIGFRYALS